MNQQHVALTHLGCQVSLTQDADAPHWPVPMMLAVVRAMTALYGDAAVRVGIEEAIKSLDGGRPKMERRVPIDAT